MFLSRFRVRSYELDGLGHVNHAVYLNYLEQARFDALADGGFPLARLAERGWGVHVVRIEVDYRKECKLGDELVARTRVERFRNSSMVLVQELFRLDQPSTPPPGRSPDPDSDPAPGETRAHRPANAPRLDDLEPAVQARIVTVWVGSDGRPMRIPQEVRNALAPDPSG